MEVAELQRDRLGLIAAAPPVVPPRPWFEKPEPEDITEGTWTVTADGQVYGYAALWDTCHTGKPGRCVKPPQSASQYGYYMTGLTEVDDGELIPTGRITLGTGHASLTASPAATAEHYDNTGAVAADVRITDGKHGIWVSGALRPDVSPERARELRGASLSGDWRNIRGKLEMLGLLAVNVPGFPVPRAMSASGEYEGHEEILALVAAGVIDGPLLLPEELQEIDDEEFEAGLADLLDAMAHSEAMTAPIDPVQAALETFSAAGFVESQHPRKGKGEKGGGQWTVKTTNADGQEDTQAAGYFTETKVLQGEADDEEAGEAGYDDEKQELLDDGWEVLSEGDGWCVLRDPESGEERRVGSRSEVELQAASDLTPEMLAQAAKVLGVTEHELLNDPGCLAADPMDLPAARAPDPLPAGEVLAAAFTGPQREKLAKKGEAMKDGSFPIRNRSDLSNAVQALGRAKDPDAARRWIIKRARAMKAVDALPASWAITAAGTFTESAHPRHPKGSDSGGEFAPKGMVKGPGGKMMSKTEAGVLLDKERGKYVKSHSELPGPSVGDKFTPADTGFTERITAIKQEDGKTIITTDASNDYEVADDGSFRPLHGPPPDDTPDYLNQQTPASRKFAKEDTSTQTPEDLPQDPVKRAAAQIKPGISAVTIAQRYDLSPADANKAWKLARKRHLKEGSVRDEKKQYQV